jgi:hypothetical protein
MHKAQGQPPWILTALLLFITGLCWIPFAVLAESGEYSIDKTPLDAKDGRYTDNEHRSFVVAGCVPMNLPSPKGFSGSVWVACNDLDFAKDKVVESEFVTCLDIFENGVLQGFFIKEVNNRTWQSFRFSCRNLQKDGTVGPKWDKAKFLFNYEKEGALYETTVPTEHVSLGVFEVWNKLELRQSLLSIGIEHQSAKAIFDAGIRGRLAADIKVTDRVPPASPALIGSSGWHCPAGMVMTGAAIGHIPDKKDKHTRPVYILAECRKLLRR